MFIKCSSKSLQFDQIIDQFSYLRIVELLNFVSIVNYVKLVSFEIIDNLSLIALLNLHSLQSKHQNTFILFSNLAKTASKFIQV